MDWLEVMEVFDLVAAGLLVGLLVVIWLGTAAEPSERLQDEVALGDPEAENGSEGPSEAD